MPHVELLKSCNRSFFLHNYVIGKYINSHYLVSRWLRAYSSGNHHAITYLIINWAETEYVPFVFLQAAEKLRNLSEVHYKVKFDRHT